MNRRIFLAAMLAAMPGLLCAQALGELPNIRGSRNFVDSDEVLNGDMVCQKVKVGAWLPASADAAKPLAGAVISGSESMNVVDTAKASAKKAGPAKEGAAEESPAAAKPVAVLAVPSNNAERAPLAPTTPVTKPEMVLPVTQSPRQSIAEGEPLRGATATAPR